MNRLIRLLLLSAVAFGVLIVTLFFFDKSAFNRYALQLLTDRLSTDAVRVSAETFALSGLGFILTSVKILVVKLFLTLQVDLFALNCMSAGILWGKPTCSMSGNLYSGEFDAVVDLSPTTATVRSATVRNLAIGTHSQVQALGFKGGLMSAQINDLTANGRVPAVGTASASIRNLTLSRPLQISPRITGLPFPVTVPAFTIESLHANAEFDRKELHVEGTTTLGSFVGSSGIAFGSPFDFVITLSARGLEELRGPLSLVCPLGTIEQSEKIRLKGSALRVECLPAI